MSSTRSSRDESIKSYRPAELIYLDNNATTIMPQEVINSMNKWCNMGNTSSSYESANKCKKLLRAFRSMIATNCNFNMDTMNGYTILFTSGGSESNSMILTSTVRAYARKTGLLPHIITTEIEHKSILMCCEDLIADKLCTVSYLPIITEGNNYGCVNVAKLPDLIRPNTCLVTIMAVNNESGIMNDIALAGTICTKAKIPFHTDTVQLFGKTIFNPTELRVDSFSVSFHKIHAPVGTGLLVIRNSFIKGYELKALVHGTQNYALRGGTENLPGLAGAFRAYEIISNNYAKENILTTKRRDHIKESLIQNFPTCYIQDYTPNHNKPVVIVWLSPKLTKLTVGWTLFIAIDKPNFCNIKLKEKLERAGIIISIGSACSTADPKASHIVYAMIKPEYTQLKKGVIRISLSHMTTNADIEQFCRVLIHYINKL